MDFRWVSAKFESISCRSLSFLRQYEERFYRRTPPEAERGGISVMT